MTSRIEPPAGSSRDLRELNRESQAIWDAKAKFWDERMGDEGNAFQHELVGPAAERLLRLRPGELALDLACGNGFFARWLARLGARVVAVDFSRRLLELAAARSGDLADRIDYRLVDATDEAQLLALGEGRFDAVVCNQALMDIPTIEPLARCIPRLLKSRGRFVFTVPHPCFNSTGAKLMLEEEDREGTLVETYAVKMSQYLHLPPRKAAGMPGEPQPHYYFDRTLGELLSTFFRVGLVMDGIDEPAFGPEVPSASGRPLSWTKFRDIPPVLAVRMRPD